MEKYKYIDLFSGIGGMRIPLDRRGHECVFSSEVDKFAIQVYEHNHKDKVSGDITKIKSSDIPHFDILMAGFPCQPFSFAGAKMGFEDKARGTLFFEIARILKDKRPKMFLLENVKGFKSHDGGKTLATIEESLEELGYEVYHTILNSHHFGVPQKRERWYCVGFDKRVDFTFPEGNRKGTLLKDIIDVNEDNPKLKLSDFEIDRIKFHFESDDIRVQHDNSQYAPHTKKGKHGVFSFLKPDGALRFHIGDASKTQIQEAYYVSLSSVAPTIIATREPKLWDLKRRLSVNECRKLQGFPEEFQFNVSDAQAKKQLGNSVAVPVIDKIVHNMIESYKADVAPKATNLFDFSDNFDSSSEQIAI
jgi:DNA (cytosine-5)-methyltransferase 1